MKGPVQRIHRMLSPYLSLGNRAFQPRAWMSQAYLSASQADVHARVEVRGIAEKSAWE